MILRAVYLFQEMSDVPSEFFELLDNKIEGMVITHDTPVYASGIVYILIEISV